MARAEPAAPSYPAAFALRAAACFVLWLMIAGRDAEGLPLGAATAAFAASASLRLTPPGRSRSRPLVFVRLFLRFARQSIVAGLDVAWRAFDPRLPLHPGFVVYRLDPTPSGVAQSAFCAFSSLLPGALPTGPDEDGALLVHCLDTRQPVVASLAAEEALFMRALGYGDAP